MVVIERKYEFASPAGQSTITCFAQKHLSSEYHLGYD